MKKSFNILLALVITFFTLPFGGITALAEAKGYANLEDGEYDIGVKALEENSEKESAADGFLIDTATLSIDGDDILLTFYYTKDFVMDYGINWTKLEDEDAIDTDEDDKQAYFTFQINEIKEIYGASMNYYVPAMPGDMGDKDKGHSVNYRIVLSKDDLDKLPEKEEPTVAPEERVEGTHITESEADAVYELEYETDSPATASNLENPVKLLEVENKKYIQIPINERGAQYFRSLEINDEQVVWNSITEGPYTIQFELPGSIEDTLLLNMVIQAGPNVMPHDGIEIWFNTDSIETIKEPKPEEPEQPEQPQPAPEERVVGTLISETEADAVYELEYETDSPATAGNLENPIKLLEIEDKKYIQIPINERGAQYFRSLKINDEQVVWNSITEAPYVIQFELAESLENTLLLDMVIQAGPRVMPHDGIKVWFDTDTLKPISTDSEKVEVEQGKKAPVKANDIITIKDSQDTQLVMPEDLPEDTNVTINPVPEKQIKNLDNLKVAGDVLEFDFEGLEGYEGTFELVMGYDTDKYDPEQVDIYYYDEVKSEWIAQEGTVENGKITINPTHFSTYGVFATEIDATDPSGPTDSLVPDKAYEIDFVIKHEVNDEPSLADAFFESRAVLLEKDGERYLQITTTANSGQYIKSFRNILGDDYEEMVIVEQTEDGRKILQFKLDGELSDVVLIDMVIDVAGVYENMHHDARIFLDPESLEEVDASLYYLVASTNPNGPDASEGVTPVDPEPTPTPKPTPGESTPTPEPEPEPTPDRPDDFGDGDNGGDKEGTKTDNSNNPQTGDTTNLLLYTVLLIGSLIPLAVKLKRRFV